MCKMKYSLLYLENKIMLLYQVVLVVFIKMWIYMNISNSSRKNREYESSKEIKRRKYLVG